MLLLLFSYCHSSLICQNASVIVVDSAAASAFTAAVIAIKSSIAAVIAIMY